MNKLNSSLLPLVALSTVLSRSAVVAVAAHWPNRGNAATAAPVVTAKPVAKVHNVRVVMHDPGCHWFQSAGGGVTKTMAVKGPVVLTNMDEAALKVVGTSRTKQEPVGSRLYLSRGTYAITMVGQAPDDNHLKLTVS